MQRIWRRCGSTGCGEWLLSVALRFWVKPIKRLPGELREQYPEHDWRGAAGLRDIVAHGYDWVDHEVLWDAVRDDFPSLFATLEQMLSDLGGELPMTDDAIV